MAPPFRVLLAASLLSTAADAFGALYVAKAEAGLHHQAAQVVIARDGARTALTISSDYRGEPKEFALVVPVPVVLTKEQVNVGEKALLERIDAYSAPRLVETFDPDPCERRRRKGSEGAGSAEAGRAKLFGITTEAQYTVGEYDILILSAKESDGLETWLRESGYRLPSGASTVLQSYIKQGMKFFVARVNLEEQPKTGFRYLRPIQFAFESPKLMLPIRLGMVSSDGPQDLIVYGITRRGRLESTNYRTVRVPSGSDLPLFVKERFADFYRAAFETAYHREDRNVVFLEYAWNMASCDPCAAEPLTPEELRKLGVFWLAEPSADDGPRRATGKRIAAPKEMIWGGSRPVEAFLTRLHVRYDAEHFPEDLMFRETEERESFQGRYVVRHPYEGDISCGVERAYRAQVRARREREAATLASLTGWEPGKTQSEAGLVGTGERRPPKKWYNNIFK